MAAKAKLAEAISRRLSSHKPTSDTKQGLVTSVDKVTSKSTTSQHRSRSRSRRTSQSRNIQSHEDEEKKPKGPTDRIGDTKADEASHKKLNRNNFTSQPGLTEASDWSRRQAQPISGSRSSGRHEEQSVGVEDSRRSDRGDAEIVLGGNPVSDRDSRSSVVDNPVRERDSRSRVVDNPVRERDIRSRDMDNPARDRDSRSRSSRDNHRADNSKILDSQSVSLIRKPMVVVPLQKESADDFDSLLAQQRKVLEATDGRRDRNSSQRGSRHPSGDSDHNRVPAKGRGMFSQFIYIFNC